MVYKLINIGKIGRNSGAIAIFFLFINALAGSSTEYVFTAPPESGSETREIPESQEEYPLYECQNESGTGENDVLDSHDCVCTDCEAIPTNSELGQPDSTLETEAERS